MEPRSNLISDSLVSKLEKKKFVYSVLAVGGTSSPQQIRSAVQDIQLHPVKKLLFLKFTEKVIRDEVATRLHSGLVWPAFATTHCDWLGSECVLEVW